MAKNKSFTIYATADLLLRLANAISCYVEAAYPPGGNECGQVARETLLTTVQSIVKSANSGEVKLRTRQRRMLVTAVEWYCAEHNESACTNGTLAAIIS